jgi:hypothetical protein
VRQARATFVKAEEAAVLVAVVVIGSAIEAYRPGAVPVPEAAALVVVPAG